MEPANGPANRLATAMRAENAPKGGGAGRSEATVANWAEALFDLLSGDQRKWIYASEKNESNLGSVGTWLERTRKRRSWP